MEGKIVERSRLSRRQKIIQLLESQFHQSLRRQFSICFTLESHKLNSFSIQLVINDHRGNILTHPHRYWGKMALLVVFSEADRVASFVQSRPEAALSRPSTCEAWKPSSLRQQCLSASELTFSVAPVSCSVHQRFGRTQQKHAISSFALDWRREDSSMSFSNDQLFRDSSLHWAYTTDEAQKRHLATECHSWMCSVRDGKKERECKRLCIVLKLKIL